MTDTGSMTGKTVLITGGTGGIGKAAAIGLATMGARVGITGRDRARAEEAAAAITRESGIRRSTSSSPTCRPRPRSGGWQTRSWRAYPRLDVLLNNVGGFWAHRHVTADGLEHTFALNHLAPVPADEPPARSPHRERSGARRHGVVRGTRRWARSTSTT